jgi:hypothetical protein
MRRAGSIEAAMAAMAASATRTGRMGRVGCGLIGGEG